VLRLLRLFPVLLLRILSTSSTATGPVTTSGESQRQLLSKMRVVQRMRIPLDVFSPGGRTFFTLCIGLFVAGGLTRGAQALDCSTTFLDEASCNAGPTCTSSGKCTWNGRSCEAVPDDLACGGGIGITSIGITEFEPAEIPVKEPAETPVKEPAEIPVKEPAETSVKEPAETSVKEPAETSVKEPPETSVKDCSTHNDKCEDCLAAGCSMYGGSSECTPICPMDVACYQSSDDMKATCQLRTNDFKDRATCAASKDCSTCTATKKLSGQSCIWMGWGCEPEIGMVAPPSQECYSSFQAFQAFIFSDSSI